MAYESTQVQIEFNSDAQAKAFFKWFKREGFDGYMLSKEANKLPLDSQPSCLATDEKVSEACDMYYFEIE